MSSGVLNSRMENALGRILYNGSFTFTQTNDRIFGNCSCVALGSGSKLRSTSPIRGVVPPASMQSYGARWKIESGFKEIKQEIGSARSQTRNAHAVNNHLNFCMMAATVTWIYADRIKADPERRHVVKGRTSFAFSDVRRLIADAALSDDFLRLWPNSGKTRKNSFVSLLMRMVA